MTRQWIGLHLPALPLEAWLALLPAAEAARPQALLADHRLTHVNAAARAGGARPGQRRSTALALVPELALAEADPAREAEALLAVTHAAMAFSPLVGLSPPQGAWLEVGSCLRYFGGLPRLLARLREALAPQGHALQIACAPTALGAALLARWRGGFDVGAHVTDRAALVGLLDTAPLALLASAQRHGEALQGMGLQTLGDLARLPRAGLARRFGPELLDELDRARGDAPDPQVGLQPALRFASRLELPARADDTDALLAGARVLLARLTAWAQSQHGRIVRCTLRMHAETSLRQRDDDGPTELTLALAEPTADVAHLQSLLAERLARLPLRAPAEELSLQCDALVPGEPPNGELFPSAAGAREGLTRLVERLQARLGREQVCRAERVADHRPERATRWVPADGTLPARVPPPSVESPSPTPRAHRPLARATAPPITRPGWLLPAPRPLATRGATPLFEGRPLVLLAGPERIETGWWDGDLVTRDYFVAQAHDGALAWVFRDRLPASAAASMGEGSGWHLHGWFA